MHYKAKRAAMIRSFQNEVMRNESLISENQDILEDFKNLPNQNKTTDREMSKLLQENLRLTTRNSQLRMLIDDLKTDTSDQKSLVDNQ